MSKYKKKKNWLHSIDQKLKKFTAKQYDLEITFDGQQFFVQYIHEWFLFGLENRIKTQMFEMYGKVVISLF